MSEISDNDNERDARLTAIYRAAAQDAPPAALDAAIAAAARRAVGARPRRAGFAFVRAWRTSLSIAAVLILSVSLVTLMREEAPELTAPPRAAAPAADAKVKSSVSADEAADGSGSGREERTSKNIGLKPSPPSSSLRMRRPEFVEDSSQSKKDTVAAESDLDSAQRAGLAKRGAALPDAIDLRNNKDAAPPSAARPRLSASPSDAPREILQAPAAPPLKEAAKPAQAVEPAADRAAPATAAMAGAPTENKTQVGQSAANAVRVAPASRAQSSYAPARQAAETLSAGRALPAPVLVPAAPPAMSAAPAVNMNKLERSVNLTPEKWLERIEELRKQGKIDQARASLVDFRKHYPGYQLPDSLRDWAQP